MSGQFGKAWCLDAQAPQRPLSSCPNPSPTIAMHPAPCTYTMCMRQHGGCRPASPYHHAPRHQPHPPYFPLPPQICVAETLAPAPPCSRAVCSPPPAAMHPAPCAHIMRMRQQGGCRPASPCQCASAHFCCDPLAHRSRWTSSSASGQRPASDSPSLLKLHWHSARVQAVNASKECVGERTGFGIRSVIHPGG